MGLYVEVMCDKRLVGSDSANVLMHRCWSDRNDSPQGKSIAEARKAAREAGWKIGPGDQAVCPGCLNDAAPFLYGPPQGGDGT